MAHTGDAATWSSSWRSRLLAHARPDGNWPWTEHIERADKEDGRLCLAVVREKVLDALLSLSIGSADSRLDAGRDVVYVEYVGIAPEHQPEPVGQRTIAGLGRFLIEVAARISTECGYGGHLGLHAKPDVEDFYRALRLHECAAEVCDDGVWRYFEACPFWLRGEQHRRGRFP